MPNDNLQWLYNTGSKQFNLGTFEEFFGAMQYQENQRWLYDKLSPNYDLGTFEQYSAATVTVPDKRVQFLESFKKKYPQYSDVSDEELFGSLVNEFPFLIDVFDPEETKKQPGYMMFLEGALMRPYHEFMVGYSGATGSTIQTLDEYSKWLEKKTGIKGRGGLFEELAGLYYSRAEYHKARGIPEEQGFVDDFLRALYRGAGQFAIALPSIMALGQWGLPIYSAIRGGGDAAARGESILKGMTTGGIEGTALHFALRGVRYMPRGVGEAAGAGIFGGLTLQEELHKPEGEVDWANVTAQALLGMGLTIQGRRIPQKEFFNNMKNGYNKGWPDFLKWAKQQKIPQDTANRLYTQLELAEKGETPEKTAYDPKVKKLPTEIKIEKGLRLPSEEITTPLEPFPEYAKVDAVEKLNTLLKKAKPVRKKMETQYTKERAKRITKIDKFIEEQIEEVGGEEGYRAVLSKLKGELIKPEAKIVFEPLKNKITDAELKDIYLRTWKHPYLDNWEKISTVEGLTRLLSGEIPRPKQLILLEEVYGTELIKSILSKRLWGTRAKDVLVEVANIPRALLATADMSAFLRQGIIPAISHPVISTKAAAKTFKFAFNAKSFRQYFKDLPNDPMYPLIRKSKLAITDPSRARMTGREEPFISGLLQKIPVLGIPVRFAERAYVGFLNKVRVDLFKSWSEELTAQGMSPVKDAHIFKAAANIINTFTGRGSLGKLDRVTPELNVAFFSPRLIAARFNALNPVWYMKQPKIIRKKAIGDFAKFVSVGLTTLALIKLYAEANPDADITIEIDPRSSDFGKIRIGNTRWDIWGGFQQWARAFTQLITGQRKYTTTGEIVSLTKDVYPFSTRKEVLLRFIEGKLAPVPALLNELISGGKTWAGEDITLETTYKEKLIPMYIQDITDAYAEGGIGRAIGAGIPAFLGIGVQTYLPYSPIDRKRRTRVRPIR